MGKRRKSSRKAAGAPPVGLVVTTTPNGLGAMIVESDEETVQRFYHNKRFLKCAFPALIVTNVCWCVGKVAMDWYDCSALKSFASVCPCEGLEMHSFEAMRYYVCHGWAQTAGWFLLVYKPAARIRDGEQLKLLPVVPTRVAPDGGMSVVETTEVPSPMPQQVLSEAGGTDKALWPTIFNFSLLVGVLYAIGRGGLMGGIGMSVPPVFALFMAKSVYLSRRLARKLAPTLVRDVSQPVVVLLGVICLEAVVVTMLTSAIKAVPSLAEPIVTVFPFFITVFEAIMERYISRSCLLWTDGEVSLLARAAVANIEAFRTGLLLAAASMAETTSVFQGPFFNAAMLGLLSDMAVRNELHITLRHKFNGVEDAELPGLRNRFHVIYAGTKTDTSYVAWVVVLMMNLYNWGGSININDCNGHPHALYSPPVEYIIAGIMVEVLTDISAYLIRRLLKHVRPLWAVPMHLVSCDKSSNTELVVMWCCLFVVSMTGVAATTFMLDNDTVDATTE